MTPDTLLTELQTRGIKVRRDGDRLLVTDPARSLTPGLSAAIKKHKAALIERLPATPIGQLPLGVMDDRPTIGGDSKPAQSAAAPSSPAAAALMKSGQDQGEISDQLVSDPTPATDDHSVAGFIIYKGGHATQSNDAIAQALIEPCPGMTIHEWPADPARRARLWQMLVDPRCAEYYAAHDALADLYDRAEREPIDPDEWPRVIERCATARAAAAQLSIEVIA